MLLEVQGVASLGSRVELRGCEMLQRRQEVLFLDLGAGCTLFLLVKSYQLFTYFIYTYMYTYIHFPQCLSVILL